jgi:DNA polymerase I
MSNQSQESSIKNLDKLLLISATYDSKKKVPVLKFYDSVTQEIILWEDKTGHKPYCFSKLLPDEIPPNISERDDGIEIKQVERLDSLNDKMINVSKIIVKDPLAIGGTQSDKSIRNLITTWESDIKYYENYLYDNSLIVGKYYKIENDKIIPDDLEISDETKLSLKSMLLDKLGGSNLPDTEQFNAHVSQWAELLNQPIPQIKRISLDIEVESVIGRIPDPKIAEKIITAIGFEASDGLKQVFVLRRNGIQEGVNELLPGIDIIFYDETKEKEMILDVFELVKKYPLLITYNGDGFDLPYLYNRADKLGIEREKNPFYMMRDSATLKKGVHLDLYRTMSNRAFQIYVFGQKYTDFSLNSVASGILNEKKIDYGVELNDLTLYQTAKYCQNDARLTYNLTSINNDLLMNLLVVISRIARMPIDDISRMGVSQWIRSLLYYEHRKNGILIPRSEELEKKSAKVANESIIRDKKFRGGLVVEPKEGVHFDVTVMDFASLYPSIIKVKNLSYETVRCSHAECKKNTIPQTNHWVCNKKNGLTSVLIGSLRDLRVNYYKTMTKKSSLTDEERQLFTVSSQALKVILNASYGVMGAEIFPLYFLPAAEAKSIAEKFLPPLHHSLH